MDFIKSQFDRIQQQLAGLTASQKMLCAALVAIIVMALWSWGNYASKPEMEALLNQQLQGDELSRIDMQLTAAGIEHRVENSSTILVPTDKKLQALANLGYANVLPKDTASGFDEMIKQLTAWDGQNRQDAIFNHGKELTLQQVIGRFPDVATATVILDPHFKRSPGQDTLPTASVSVTMRDGRAGTKQLAKACAQLVSGAQAGLSTPQVKVMINGRNFPVADENDSAVGMGGTTLLEMQQAAETSLTNKLRQFLEYIDGVRVSVTVKVDNSTLASESTKVDKENSYSEAQEITKKTREESTSQPPAGEAGVMPNSGLVAASAPSAAPQQSSTESDQTTKNLVIPGVEKTQKHTPAGAHTPVAASVRVPRSYFVMIAKANKGDQKDPTEAELQKAIDLELPKIKTATAAITGITQLDAVTVEPFTDFPVPATTEQVAVASPVATMLSGHVKEIALSVLAAFSLFMMSMIVRKGTPVAAVMPAPVAAPKPVNTNVILNAAEALAGEVSEQSPALDGMELDEDAIKTQQMLSQVTSMVGENPDSAAQLIKRWMNQR